MLQDEAATGVVVVDPDAASPSPAPSSSLPPTQLSPETLRALVLECGREEAEEEEKACSASTSTAAALKTRDRLRGQLGFCFEPMPWDQAVAAIADGGVEAMGRMGRTPEGVARYWRWRDEVCAKEYASTADFVRVEIVGFEVGVAGGEFWWVFFVVVASSSSTSPSHFFSTGRSEKKKRKRKRFETKS